MGGQGVVGKTEDLQLTNTRAGEERVVWQGGMLDSMGEVLGDLPEEVTFDGRLAE